MIETSAPGRICLFGEHQDYLRLPVVTAAIDLRLHIEGEPTSNGEMRIELPDMGKRECFTLPSKGEEIPYRSQRDYLRSAFNVARRFGVFIEQGWRCRVHGAIPIRSGTSSSSALVVAWIRFLTKISAIQKEEFGDPAFIARLAHLAEVEEFKEPGGMMDHYAVAVGGVLWQDFIKGVTLEKYHLPSATFVLGDSQQYKATLDVLNRVKGTVLEAVRKIKRENPAFRLKTTPVSEMKNYASLLSAAQFEVLWGAVHNRDLTREAVNLLRTKKADARQLGSLMSEHHRILAEQLHISTPKIERMLEVAIKAGAFGGKINGSGGGGCMFVYAPENSRKIARAIEAVGGRAHILKITSGVE